MVSQYDASDGRLAGMLGIGIFWVMFQRIFGYSHGLDSMTPDFDSVWMGLFRLGIPPT